MSHHEILPNMKSAEKSSSGKRKFKQKTESEPNYGVSKTDQFRHLPSGEIKPQFSKQFHETLRGKEATMPELNEALMSHHEIFPDKKGAGKSTPGFPKGRLKPKYETTYGVSKIATSRHPMRNQKEVEMSQPRIIPVNSDGYKNNSLRSILKSKASLSSHQILNDMDKKGLSFPSNMPKEKKTQAPVVSSSKHRPYLIGKKLEKFNYYIRNSLPDRKIIEQSGSKDAICYLNTKSITNLMSEKSGQIRYNEISEMAGKSGHPSGSDITQSFQTVSEREKASDSAMFDADPKDYQDTNLKKTLSKLITSFVKAQKAKKKSKSKHRVMPSACPSDSELKTRRNSSVSLKSVGDEIKQFEHEALKEFAWQKQYQEEFVVEEKADVQARIQELMKYVAIREDFQPPKPPRDFIMENIEMLQKMRPRKIEQTKKKRKPNQKYPNLIQKLQMPERSKFFGQQLSDTTYELTKKRCCRSQDQQEHQQAKPKAPEKTVLKETQKCDTFDAHTSE
ncbi:hypothetical protein KR200_001994 [Drosophila serrata]|nr:hypothetical protein KR200_001994 [Drosophila serrata]